MQLFVLPPFFDFECIESSLSCEETTCGLETSFWCPSDGCMELVGKCIDVIQEMYEIEQYCEILQKVQGIYAEFFIHSLTIL